MTDDPGPDPLFLQLRAAGSLTSGPKTLGGLVVSTEISWVFEAAIKPDALDEYGALAREISADNRAAEPGQRIFEWFVDGQDVHIYERYQDSAAALAHVQRFVENFASRFLSLCSPTRMSVYGEPSDELKVALTGFSPRYLEPLEGYARS